MARMPQIPEPEISSLPRVEPSREQVDFGAVGAPAEDAAKSLSNIGDTLASAQDQRDKAQAKLQAVKDGVTAERMKGDHDENARNLLDQLQKDNVDNPEKVPDLYRQQLAQLTQSDVQNAPNQNVALDVAKKYAEADNQHLATAHSWMTLRMAQQVKSEVTQLAQGKVREAQAATTPGGFALAAANAEASLTMHFRNASATPDEDVKSLKQKMALGFVQANGPDRPLMVAAALRDKNGALYKSLDPAEIPKLTKDVEAWREGYAERTQRETVDGLISGNNKLFKQWASGDLDNKSPTQVAMALKSQQEAILADPQLKPEEAKKQIAAVQMQLDTLEHVKNAHDKGGNYEPKLDTALTGGLLDKLSAFNLPKTWTPKDKEKISALQLDVAKAMSAHQITADDAKTLVRGIGQLTDSGRNEREGWGVPFLSPTRRELQKAGEAELSKYFNGENKAFGKLTPEQQNRARLDYLGKWLDAVDSHANLDKDAAVKMASDALRNVVQTGFGGKE